MVNPPPYNALQRGQPLRQVGGLATVGQGVGHRVGQVIFYRSFI